MRLHRLLSICLVSLASACGGSDSDPAGPAGTTPPPGAPHAVAPGATAVPLDAPLVFALPADADGSSFSAGNVALRGEVNDGPKVWALEASLDGATRKLTVSPRRVLAAATSYVLTVNGLKGPGGAALPQVAIAFRSLVNPVRREYRPKDGPPAGFDSFLGWRFEWSHDAAGNALGSTRFYSRGPDGVGLTDDDPVVGYTVVTGTPGPGATTESELFDGAGTDQLWRTGDDVLRQRSTKVHDAHGHVARELTQSHGADKVLDTADDVFACTALVEDAEGRLTGQGPCGPGPDATYLTADDTHAIDTRWFRDADDQVIEQRYYTSGADGVLGTADDRLYSVHTYTRSPGRVLDRFYGAGNDGIFPSADDVPQSWEADELDARGRLLRSSAYIGAGPDGKVGTADDKVYYRTNHAYDANGARTASRFAYIGEDGKIDTADDDVRSELQYLTDR